MTDLWGITAYFNPAGYARRRENYRVFRKHFAVPLVAVEMAFEAADFELSAVDADILIQVRGADVMWQKERLLNLALRALPQACRKVAWVDCDIVFGSDGWAAEAERRLDDVALLQPFSRVRYLAKDRLTSAFRPEDSESVRLSIAYLAASGTPASIWSTGRRDRRNPPAVGLAWAARREILDRHGLYDACVIGGGDRAIVAAADGTPSAFAESRGMPAAFLRHYMEWAEPFQAAVRTASGFIDGDVFHLWHGSIRGRSYSDRHAGFSRFDFDPVRDIAATKDGAYRWNSDKAEMHAFVRDYLLSRKEDG